MRKDNTAASGYYENLRIDYNWNESDPAAGATPVDNRACDGLFSACIVKESNTTGKFTSAIHECANDPDINSTLCDGKCVAPAWVPPPPPPFTPGQAPPAPVPVCPQEADRPKPYKTPASATACWNAGCYFGCDCAQNCALECVEYSALKIQITGPQYNFTKCAAPKEACT